MEEQRKKLEAAILGYEAVLNKFGVRGDRKADFVAGFGDGYQTAVRERRPTGLYLVHATRAWDVGHARTSEQLPRFLVEAGDEQEAEARARLLLDMLVPVPATLSVSVAPWEAV